MKYEIGSKVVCLKKYCLTTFYTGRVYKISYVDNLHCPLPIRISNKEGETLWMDLDEFKPYWDSELERILFWGDYEDNKS